MIGFMTFYDINTKSHNRKTITLPLQYNILGEDEEIMLELVGKKVGDSS